jgi:hypothetical protein
MKWLRTQGEPGEDIPYQDGKYPTGAELVVALRCEKHASHPPNPDLEECGKCRADEWKLAADEFDKEIREFGHPMAPDRPVHEVWDHLCEAFEAGKTWGKRIALNSQKA